MCASLLIVSCSRREAYVRGATGRLARRSEGMDWTVSDLQWLLIRGLAVLVGILVVAYFCGFLKYGG